MNKAAVRRALTTLKKEGLIKNQGWQGDDFIKNKVSIVVNVDAELTQNKKRVYIKKVKNAYSSKKNLQN